MQRNLARLELVLLAGFVVVALTLGYWQFFHQDDLLARSTNPRIAEEARRVVRGRILDRTGKALAENVPTSDGANERTYPAGGLAHLVGYHSERFGNSGIEERYDDYLSGARSADPIDRAISELLHRPTVGSDIVLTLDARIQQAALDVLGGAPGAVVVLDPVTGAVLAMASAPTFDPGQIDERWEALVADGAHPLVNRAIQSTYAPGSTFKLVTAAAAVDLNLVDPRAKFRCVDPITIDGLQVDCRNHAHLANVDFREAFAWSCNRTFALTGLGLGTERLALADGLKAPFPWQSQLGRSSQRLDEYANRFWIGRSVPFDLPVEAGQVKGGGEWYASLLAQTSFGQGELTATPLQMALTAATIANGGAVPTPFVASEARAPGGARTTLNHGTGMLGQAVSSKTAQTVNEMMVLSVDTAWAKAASIPGTKVGGKTGTAEAGAEGSTPHSWFVGYAPADDPRVAIAIIMEHKGSGTDFAAPAARVVLQRALEVYKRRPPPAGTSARRLLLSFVAGRSEAQTMVTRSTPPLRDISADAGSGVQNLDPDSAEGPTEPIRPSEGPRRQILALAPSPSRVAMIGGAIGAALLGGAVGYWLGKRHAKRPARPVRRLAATIDSAMDLAPVAMHLLANPLIRALALRVVLRQISRRIDH